MTGARRAAGTLLLLAFLLASSPLQGRGADGLLPPLPPAADPFSGDAGESVLIARVYANTARDDEFIELANAGSAMADLGGWSLTDREDRATFPAATWLASGARLVVTRNATSYAEDERQVATFTYDRGDAPRMEGGVLRLADAGDEVLLCDPSGRVADAYIYGTSAYAGEGWTGPPAAAMGRGEIATRTVTKAGWMDRDQASDWEGFRAYRLGQSAFDPPRLETAAEPVVLVSPDDGRGRLLSFLASSGHSLEVAVYTLTSDAIASVLIDRARSGVRVRVLLEGSPVGGVDDHERELVGALLDAGIEVRSLSGGLNAVKRYRYLHAKYAVVDGSAVLVSSENFGDSGFPGPGQDGNRGWSVIVEDLALARQLWEVFEEDFDPERSDSVPAAGMRGPPPQAADAMPPWLPAPTSGSRSMQLVVGPDTNLADDGVLGLFASARERIWIQAFYADDSWDGRTNPLLDAAFAAASRGVSVRVLLDGSGWISDEEPTANDALATILNDRARLAAVDLEVRVFSPVGSVERVHNKGAVVDGRAALVSSMNWARGSATENREIGLIVEDPAVASRLEAVFLADWEGRPSSAGGEVAIADPSALLALYAFITAASAASLRKLRRRDKGLKRPRRMVLRDLLRASLRGRHREVRLLPAELVAEPRDGAGGGAGDRARGEEAFGGFGGPQRNRDP